MSSGTAQAQMSHLRRFYEDIEWYRLRPFMACFDSEYAFNNTIYAPQVTADPDMNTVVVFFGDTYRTNEGAAMLSLLKNSPYTLRWFDPRTGHFSLITDKAHPVGGTLPLPNKPDGRDWVFVAQTRTAN